MIRAAMYTRVSSIEQAREGFSLDVQIKSLTQYCEAKGYCVVGEAYVDAGRSGKSIAGRESFQRLIADALAGKIDVIVIWTLSRFSRNLADFLTTCDALEAKGVYVESLHESFDSRTPTGRLLRAILASIAQWEREIISENVSAAVLERAQQGLRTCPYALGYRRDGKETFKIDKEKAEIVRWIYAEYLRIGTVKRLAEECARRDYRGLKGNVIGQSALHKILRTPLYCGYNRLHDELYPGKHPPIVDVQTYNAVQRMLDANPNAGRRRRHAMFILHEGRNGVHKKI